MAWYDNAVFYHIYPLGLCGCAHENDGQAVPGAFNKLNAWAEHAADLGCTAIYIGPLFESGSHGYDTIDYRLVDRRLGTNAEFKDFVGVFYSQEPSASSAAPLLGVQPGMRVLDMCAAPGGKSSQLGRRCRAGVCW